MALEEEPPKLASSWLRRLGRLILTSVIELEANARETYVDVDIDADEINQWTYGTAIPRVIASFFRFNAGET